MSAPAYADAFMSLVEGRRYPIWDGAVPSGTTAPSMYGLVFFPQPERFTDRKGGRQVNDDTEIVTHAVGLSPAMARWVAKEIEDAVLERQPVIAGRRVSPIRQAWSESTLRVDQQADPLVYFLVTAYRLSTTPA